ncbi:MAG: hypothetical protein ABFD69_02765 [Candidatus Sumerlaeia bacterium]
MMSDEGKKPLARQLLILALIGAPFVLLVIVAGLLLYHGAAMPSVETYAKAEKRYRETRALFADPITTVPVQAAPVSITVQTTESLQARCDRLFLELLVPQAPLNANEYAALDSKLETALELAGMYDRGVMVSSEAKTQYRVFQHAGALGYLAGRIAYAHNPRSGHPEFVFNEPDPAVRAQKFGDLVNALKFMDVIDCPMIHCSVYDVFDRCITPMDWRKQDMIPVLPPEVAAMDLALIAPRRPIDWDWRLTQYLEYTHEHTLRFKKMSDTRFVYQQRINARRATHPEENRWYHVPVLYASGAEAVVNALWNGPEYCNRLLKQEKGLQDYAASLQETPKPPNINLDGIFHDLRPRLIAGGVALRRGERLPAPGQIGPDSWFFDPVMQRPYKFYIEKRSAGVARLCVCRPYVFETGEVKDLPEFTITLPAGHPGLENVPERP